MTIADGEMQFYKPGANETLQDAKKRYFDANPVGWTTGWRNLALPVDATTLSAATIRLRRDMTTVTASLYGVRFNAAIIPSNLLPTGIDLGVTKGFRVAPAGQNIRPIAVLTDVDLADIFEVMIYISGSKLYARLFSDRHPTSFVPGPITSTKDLAGTVSWQTDDPMPTSLPGTAA